MDVGECNFNLVGCMKVRLSVRFFGLIWVSVIECDIFAWFWLLVVECEFLG